VVEVAVSGELNSIPIAEVVVRGCKVSTWSVERQERFAVPVLLLLLRLSVVAAAAWLASSWLDRDGSFLDMDSMAALAREGPLNSIAGLFVTTAVVVVALELGRVASNMVVNWGSKVVVVVVVVAAPWMGSKAVAPWMPLLILVVVVVASGVSMVVVWGSKVVKVAPWMLLLVVSATGSVVVFWLLALRMLVVAMVLEMVRIVVPDWLWTVEVTRLRCCCVLVLGRDEGGGDVVDTVVDDDDVDDDDQGAALSTAVRDQVDATGAADKAQPELGIMGGAGGGGGAAKRRDTMFSMAAAWILGCNWSYKLLVVVVVVVVDCGGADAQREAEFLAWDDDDEAVVVLAASTLLELFILHSEVVFSSLTTNR
jgi:hypothetical protein